MKPQRPTYDPEAAGCRCSECPLLAKRKVPPEGPPDAELVIVGEAPGAQEVQRGRPFVGPSGMLLKEILAKAGAPPRERVWLTNSLLCRPEVPGVQGKKRFDLKTFMAWLHHENKRRSRQARATGVPYEPIKSPFECCRPRLVRELGWFEQQALARGQPGGAIVIPTGNYATMMVAGKIGIMKWRGSPLVMSPPQERHHGTTPRSEGASEARALAEAASQQR